MYIVQSCREEGEGREEEGRRKKGKGRQMKEQEERRGEEERKGGGINEGGGLREEELVTNYSDSQASTLLLHSPIVGHSLEHVS